MRPAIDLKQASSIQINRALLGRWLEPLRGRSFGHSIIGASVFLEQYFCFLGTISCKLYDDKTPSKTRFFPLDLMENVSGGTISPARIRPMSVLAISAQSRRISQMSWLKKWTLFWFPPWMVLLVPVLPS